MLGIARPRLESVGRLSDLLGVPTCTSPACARDIGVPAQQILLVADSEAGDDLSAVRRALAPHAPLERATVTLLDLATARATAGPGAEEIEGGADEPPALAAAVAGGPTVVLAPARGDDVAARATTMAADLVLVPESWARPRLYERLLGHGLSRSARGLIATIAVPVVIYQTDGSAWIANGAMLPSRT